MTPQRNPSRWPTEQLREGISYLISKSITFIMDRSSPWTTIINRIAFLAPQPALKIIQFTAVSKSKALEMRDFTIKHVPPPMTKAVFFPVFEGLIFSNPFYFAVQTRLAIYENELLLLFTFSQVYFISPLTIFSRWLHMQHHRRILWFIWTTNVISITSQIHSVVEIIFW